MSLRCPCSGFDLSGYVCNETCADWRSEHVQPAGTGSFCRIYCPPEGAFL